MCLGSFQSSQKEKTSTNCTTFMFNMANIRTYNRCCILAFLFSFPVIILSEPLVPCYFIFGDSLFDNGNNNELETCAKVNYPPYGVDFPGSVSTGRFSNGRNIADFIAMNLGFSDYIQPFATVNDNEISRGVNYASGGAGILAETGKQLGEVIFLDKQLINHQTAISRIAALQGNKSFTDDYLRKCIYTVGMGNNDYIQNYFAPEFHNSSLLFTPEQYAKALILKYSEQLQTLYKLGARKVATFGLSLSGCSPAEEALFGTGRNCVTKIIDAVKLFNDKLQPLADDLNTKFKDAKFVVVQALPFIPSIPGVLRSKSPCCKVSIEGGTRGQCIPNGDPCNVRLQYIFFDGFHPTESASFLTAQAAFIDLIMLI